MNCLRCADVELSEHVREGVVIDVCPRCRGVWLDRGELEKLVARLGRDEDDGRDDHDDDDDDDDRFGRRRGGRGARDDRDRDDDQRPRGARGGWMDRFSQFFD